MKTAHRAAPLKLQLPDRYLPMSAVPTPAPSRLARQDKRSVCMFDLGGRTGHVTGARERRAGAHGSGRHRALRPRADRLVVALKHQLVLVMVAVLAVIAALSAAVATATNYFGVA